MTTAATITTTMTTATTRLLLAILAMGLLVLLPGTARADGFVCLSVDEDTRIDVYLTALNPETGKAREVAKLVFSDPNITPARQHIATFEATDGLLKCTGSSVEATVDLLKKGTSKAGERIGGTRLGALKAIVLNVDASYEEPINEGMRYAADVTYVKRNGQELTQDFDCTLFPGQSPGAIPSFY